MTLSDPPIRSGAVLSDDGVYRYRLDRRWGPEPALGFVMLNPSTADASVDDPTIRRCMGFARREGAGGVSVVNLFALRATNPAELLTHPAPIGPENKRHIIEFLTDESVGTVVAAWGAWLAAHNVPRLVPQNSAVALGRTLWALGVTKDGYPRHPLYLRADAPLRRWP